MATTPYLHFDLNHPPAPLLTGEAGSFAHYTITTRIPAILATVLADHQAFYPPPIMAQLRELQRELVDDQPLRPLITQAPDAVHWANAWAIHREQTWHNIPWYFAEAFFYRRLIEAVDYFGAVPWAGLDPFLPSKQAELAGETAWRVLLAALQAASEQSMASLRTLLHFCLWGNRVDLSYLQVAQASGRQIVIENETANLVVDDTELVVAHLQALGNRTPSERRIDFICDNTGTELLTDLALADFLLAGDWAARVILHVKCHPTFVSDTIIADVDLTLAAMQAQAERGCTDLAQRLTRYLALGKLVVRADWFWNSSHFFWQIPALLQRELAQAQLVIIKGDANYRRLLGDSRWPTTVTASAAIPYFPTALVALRTLKSEPIVGLQPGHAATLDQADSAWRVNGKRGMIQAVLK